MLSWFRRAKYTMADSSQVQKAGAGASQFQVGVLNVGIDEKRAREICDEKISDAIRDLTGEAFGVAKARVEDLVTMTLAKIQKQKADMSSFADPKFQREIAKAQSSAASSDRKSDIEMLSELLVARMDGKLQRKTHTGISRAIEIVSDVDDDELLALTAVHAVGCYYPSSIKGHSIKEGLFALNRLYEQLKVSDLPQGEGWMENLNMLDAIIISPIGGFKKIVEYFEEKLDGYVCAGIGMASPEFNTAKQILKSAGLSENILVPHQALQGYVRLPVVRLPECSDLQLLKYVTNRTDGKPMPMISTPSLQEVQAMEKVVALYAKDASLLTKVKKAFEDEWAKFPALVEMQKWFDGLHKSFEITKVGMALAYVNAKRCAPDLPPLRLE